MTISGCFQFTTYNNVSGEINRVLCIISLSPWNVTEESHANHFLNLIRNQLTWFQESFNDWDHIARLPNVKFRVYIDFQLQFWNEILTDD